MLSDTQRFGHKGQWSHQTSTGWFVFVTIEFSAFALQSISPLAPQLQIWCCIVQMIYFSLNQTYLVHHLCYTGYVMPNTCISLVWFLSFFSYTKTTFLLQKNNESTLLHFDQFFAVFENGSTDWSWICWKYIACGFGIDWGLISAKRCQIDWLSRWIAAANDSHRAEEIKESIFF